MFYLSNNHFLIHHRVYNLIHQGVKILRHEVVVQCLFFAFASGRRALTGFSCLVSLGKDNGIQNDEEVFVAIKIGRIKDGMFFVVIDTGRS